MILCCICGISYIFFLLWEFYFSCRVYYFWIVSFKLCWGYVFGDIIGGCKELVRGFLGIDCVGIINMCCVYLENLVWVIV